LVVAEAKKGSRSVNPDVTDLAMQGWTFIWRAQAEPMKERRETINEARALFDRALQIDPDDADALAGSALTYYAGYFYGWGDPGTDYEAKILGQADKAILLAPDNVRAYYPKGAYLSISHRPGEGLAAAQAGLAINPNFVMLFLPRIEAELSLGRTDAAGDQFGQAIDLGYRVYTVYGDLAALYANVGKMDQAKVALADARRLNPKLTVKWWTDHLLNIPAVTDGLRKAGLPEE
jgi:tetratricopeptide (TPR) repeat protein